MQNSIRDSIKNKKEANWILPSKLADLICVQCWIVQCTILTFDCALASAFKLVHIYTVSITVITEESIWVFSPYLWLHSDPHIFFPVTQMLKERGTHFWKVYWVKECVKFAQGTHRITRSTQHTGLFDFIWFL